MSSSPRKVLVADSDEIVLALISHILCRQGYAVDVALSADEAAARLAQREYHAVLIDVRFASVLDGIPNLMPRTILLSPNGDVELPVHSVIRKPVEFGLLVDAVADCTREPDE